MQGKCSWYKLSEQQAQPVCQDSLYVQNAELAFSLNSDEKDVWLSAKLENGNTDFGQSHVSIEGKFSSLIPVESLCKSFSSPYKIYWKFKTGDCSSQFFFAQTFWIQSPGPSSSNSPIKTYSNLNYLGGNIC